MKKLLLSLLGVLTMLPTFARDFEYTYEGQTITYTVIDEDAKTCKTKDSGNYGSNELVLPANPKDGETEYVLKEIGERGFLNCTGLTSVEIPNSVTTIGNGAFKGCTSLTLVEIPNSVTTIESSTFYNCTSLTLVEIPNSVTTIESFAFEGCTSLTSVEIPNSVTNIGREAFHNCTSLTSVEIPNSVTTIGKYAFFGCRSLTSVEIPNSVTTIGNDAFGGCTSLTSVEIPNSVTTIMYNTFSNCSGLTSVDIPNSVTTIGESAFYGCTSLTSVEIPNSVTTIGGSAFSGCSALAAVNIPNSVTTIGTHAFFNCSSLTIVIVPKYITSVAKNAFEGCTLIKAAYPKNVNNPFPYGCPVFSYNPDDSIIEDGCIYSLEKKEIRFAASFINEGFVIPNSVTSISTEAFQGCNLKYVVLPASITKLGDNIFSDCEYIICDFKKINSSSYSDSSLKCSKKIMAREGVVLSKVTDCPIYSFPDTDIIIENGTIYNADKTIIYGACGMTDSYTLASSVKEIEANAFAACDEITTLNSSVYPAPRIKETAFSGLYDTMRVNIPMDIYGDYVRQGSNWNLFSSLTPIDPNANNETFEHGGLKYRYVSDSEVEVIPFDGYKTMETIVIPETISLLLKEATEEEEALYKEVTVVGIAEFAFDGCESLSLITIPETVKRIGDGAFRKCSSLVSVDIPEGVTRIGGAAFENCTNLSIFPCSPSLTDIGSGAFGNCTSLTSVNFPDGVLRIGTSVFEGCTNLSSVTFGNSLTEIGAYIIRNTAITEIDLESGNELLIGARAFQGNELLKTVNLGNGVVSADDYSFADCKKLVSVTVSKDLKTIGKRAFNCLNAGLTTLNLPKDGRLTTIGDSAFNAIRVRQLDLPDSLTYIGDDAFGNARMITSVTLPANRNLKIGKRAFVHAQRLAKLDFPETIKEIGDSCFVDNILPEVHIKANNIGSRAFMESNKLVTLRVSGDGDMGEYAFSELPLLETATINHATVGVSAFKDAEKLKTINLGVELKALKDKALQGTAVDSISFASGPEIDPVVEIGNSITSTSLKYLSLGNRVKSLATSGFKMEPENAYIDLGQSVETIGYNAIKIVSSFMGYDLNCNYKLIVPPSLRALAYNQWYVDSVIVQTSSIPLVFGGTTNNQISARYVYIDRDIQCNNKVKIIVPDFVVKGSYLSYSSEPSENATLILGDNPAAQIEILSGMMDGFSKVHIGGAVKKITDMTVLHNITFSEGIEEITNLTVRYFFPFSLCLPASLEKLGEIWSYWVNELILKDSDTPLNITKGITATNPFSNLESVYYGRDLTGKPIMFTDAPKLESVIIGDKVTNIPDETFMNCKAMTSCVMGDNVKTIGVNAFKGCEKLDILSIGESVETIGDNAYAECTGFSKIVARSVTPPAGMAGFGMDVEDNVPLYVPEEALEDYMNSDLFFPFANIESQTSKIVEKVDVEGNIDTEFTVGSQINIPDWLRFIFHLIGHITGQHAPSKHLRAADTAAEVPLRWFAPTPHVASVDRNGLVTINKEGEFEIWAYAMDGSDKRVVISMGGEKQLKGDLNKDTKVDISDASILVSHILDSTNSQVSVSVGDLNGDGVVDMSDVDMLVEMIKNNAN